MLTWEDELEAEALFKRGWTISAIARHLGRDRKTIRAYVSGERVPGVRRRSTPQVFEPFAGYVRQRPDQQVRRTGQAPPRRRVG